MQHSMLKLMDLPNVERATPLEWSLACGATLTKVHDSLFVQGGVKGTEKRVLACDDSLFVQGVTSLRKDGCRSHH